MMGNLTGTANRQLENDPTIWENLKQAIASSSGFQRWQDDRLDLLENDDLDSKVCSYLRETLETLAY